MELLLIPPGAVPDEAPEAVSINASNAVPGKGLDAVPPKTPYCPYLAEPGQERWDGKYAFLSFAHKTHKSGLIPPMLRADPVFASLGDLQPYSEGLNPTPWSELWSLYQKWLFFGLIAEFLSLNPNEDGTTVDGITSARELDELYDAMTTDPKDEKIFIRIQWGKFPWDGRIQTRMKETPKDKLESRIKYLQKCLRMTWTMLHSVQSQQKPSDTEPSLEEADCIRFSIAALGELLSAGLMAGFILFKKIPMQSYPAAWSRDYLRPGGPASDRMMGNGWCPSDIERLRQQFNGLNSVHYLSWLSKPSRERGHVDCTASRCVAFQIGEDYETKHCNDDCKCNLMGLEIKEDVIRCLKETNSFPVLRLEPAENSEHGVRLVVETFTEGMPFVAISHVSDYAALYHQDETRVPNQLVARSGRMVWATTKRMSCIAVK
jgi:hypothetical protein